LWPGTISITALLAWIVRVVWDNRLEILLGPGELHLRASPGNLRVVPLKDIMACEVHPYARRGSQYWGYHHDARRSDAGTTVKDDVFGYRGDSVVLLRLAD